MKCTRRDLGLLLPSLVAAGATALDAQQAAPAANDSVEKLPVRPGDVGVIGSNQLHNAKNVGTTRATYFIVNIGRDDV